MSAKERMRREFNEWKDNAHRESDAFIARAIEAYGGSAEMYREGLQFSHEAIWQAATIKALEWAAEQCPESELNYTPGGAIRNLITELKS